MNAFKQANDTTPVILLYTPCLQGFYIGELVNQIRQLSFIKGYKLLVIRTGAYGQFHERFHLDSVNAVIIIRNSISTDLAEYLLEQEIPCVSIAYDYFPLPMPMITSDHKHGIQLAFNHLQQLGHKKIAFIGDLSHYDIRKRYEYYCDRHDQDDTPLSPDYLIKADDALLSGGSQAAKLFVRNQCDATSIIFGAGLTAVGFIQQMNSLVPAVNRALNYVCFDALPLIPVFTPEVVSIDQNPHIIVYRAFNVIEHQMQKRAFARQTMVPPKITQLSENQDDNSDAFIATCVDLPGLKNANYVKSLLCNYFDWPMEIASSQLDQLMSLSLLFESFMGRVLLSRYFVDGNNITWTKVIKIFSLGEIERPDCECLSKAAEFPPKYVAELYGRYDICIHIPIVISGKISMLLSFAGDPKCPTYTSSYFGFSGYIESLVKMYEQQLELAVLKKRLNNLSEVAGAEPSTKIDINATVEWVAASNQTSWSEGALARLGFTSPIEINIFRNMEITDRIHPNDIEKVRIAVFDCKQSRSSFQFEAQFRGKTNDQIDIVMVGQPQFDHQQKFSGICFTLRAEDLT